jgi:hypothetical protein
MGLSIELEDPLPLGRHEEVISLLYRWMLDEDLGDALHDGLFDLLSVTGGVPTLPYRLE